jgi:AcrR family transcriptional regulator
MAAATEREPVGLRERKKRMTRQAILDAAEELFARDGYDGVTVAQIADAANVSVKTLFTYFDSKEDLVFADEDKVRDALLDAVRDRPRGRTPLDAVRDFIVDLARRDGQAGGLEAFHAAFGNVPQLHSRMLVMFEGYEEALAEVLAEETGVPSDDPRPRFAAAQLVSLLRLITSPAARAHVGSRTAGQRGRALESWIDETADLLGRGLADYDVRADPPPRSD